MLEYKDDKWKALLALAPTLLLMVVFTFYPIFNTIISAFTILERQLCKAVIMQMKS